MESRDGNSRNIVHSNAEIYERPGKSNIYILYIIYYKRRKERFNILFIENWRLLIKDVKQNQICLHSDSIYLHYFTYSFIMEKLYKIFKVLKNIFYKIFYKRNIKNIR